MSKRIANSEPSVAIPSMWAQACRTRNRQSATPRQASTKTWPSITPARPARSSGQPAKGISAAWNNGTPSAKCSLTSENGVHGKERSGKCARSSRAIPRW